jgi:hypothetical protein
MQIAFTLPMLNSHLSENSDRAAVSVAELSFGRFASASVGGTINRSTNPGHP